MKLSIKRIESMDIGNLKRLCSAFMKEVPREYPKVDEVSLDQMMLNVLGNIYNPAFIYLIAYDGKKPAGFLFASIGEHVYGTPHKVGVCQDLYVTPTKRSKFIGFKLIREAVKIALARDVEGFECIGTYNGTDKRWERYGFKLYLTYGQIAKEDMIKLVEGRKNEGNTEISY